MSLDDDPAFKLTWRVENFRTSASVTKDFLTSPSTGLIQLQELSGTKWQIDLCPSTAEDWVECQFVRSVEDDEEEDISFAYSVYFLGNGGETFYGGSGAMLKCVPFSSKLIKIIQNDHIPNEWLVNDGLNLMFIVKQVAPSGPVDISRSFWQDELQRLSCDMQNLLESKYRSDFKLKTDDDCLISTHKFMLSARWPLLADVLSENPDQNLLLVQHVSGPILAKFVRYLYTGEIPASDISTWLFDFIIRQKPSGRNKFYTLYSDMSIRTRQEKDCLAFTWVLEDSDSSILDCFRVLPLSNMEGIDLLVEISTEGTSDPKLVITFSMCGHSRNQPFFLQCSANFFYNDYIAASISNSCCLIQTHSWRLPDFVPMSLLTGRPARRRIEFNLEIKHRSFATNVETTVTEFHTGSRSVSNVRLLSNDLFLASSGQMRQSRIFDVRLKTKDRDLFSCGALLGARSSFLRRMIQEQNGDDYIELDLRNMPGQALTSVLDFLHSGWTVVQTLDEATAIRNAAQLLRLHSLAQKCMQCWGIICLRLQNN